MTMETGRDIPGVMKLPYGYFNAKSISFFPYLLRGLGWRILNKLNRTLEEPTAQFLISVIVSYSEIACRKTKVIRQSEREWESLDRNLEYLWRFDQYSLSFNRLVFLLNHQNPYIHGEARLLDPDGAIRRQIYDSPYKRKIDKEPTNNFLAVMKEQFYEQFGENKKYVLIIFSHFIPCTLPGHMCSEILSEYATHCNEQILIGYNNVYRNTDQNLSLRLMTKRDNIYCINPKDLHLKRSCRKNATETKHEESEILETYLFDDEDYPDFKRMVKRFRNRSSKLKNRNREIKNRILKHSNKGHSSGDRYDDSDDGVDVLERKPDCL